MTWIVRPGRFTDQSYILDSWITHIGRYDSSRSIRDMKRRYGPVLQRSDAWVVCLDDNEDAILGWAVLEDDRVHMIYTRSSARRLGVQRAIFDFLAHLKAKLCA